MARTMSGPLEVSAFRRCWTRSLARPALVRLASLMRFHPLRTAAPKTPAIVVSTNAPSPCTSRPRPPPPAPHPAPPHHPPLRSAPVLALGQGADARPLDGRGEVAVLGLRIP